MTTPRGPRPDLHESLELPHVRLVEAAMETSKSMGGSKARAGLRRGRHSLTRSWPPRAPYADRMLVGGVLAGSVGALLYGLATVVQAVAARRVGDRAEVTPGPVLLVRSRAWLIGLVLLVPAFLFFALSTRTLPLAFAEALRASYVVVAAILGHLAFGTRPQPRELLGLTAAVAGLALFVGDPSRRGSVVPGTEMAVTMGAVLLGAVTASVIVAAAHRGNRFTGVAEAVSAGVAYAVVDLGVRSLPADLSLSAVFRSPTTWAAAAAAPVGLVLLSRAMTRIPVGAANAVMLVVAVVVAATWAARVFGDAVAGLWQASLATALMLTGMLVALSSQGEPAKRRD